MLASGGKFSFDFETGEWDDTAPATADTETVHYEIVDGDGDKAGADLTINVIAPPNAAPVLALDAPGNYKDEFGSEAYDNSNGSANWTTSWTETGDNGETTAVKSRSRMEV